MACEEKARAGYQNCQAPIVSVGQPAVLQGALAAAFFSWSSGVVSSVAQRQLEQRAGVGALIWLPRVPGPLAEDGHARPQCGRARRRSKVAAACPKRPLVAMATTEAKHSYTEGLGRRCLLLQCNCL